LAFFFTASSFKKRAAFAVVVGALVTTVLLTASRGGFIALVGAAIVIALDNGKLGAKRSSAGSRIRAALLSLFVVACVGAVSWPLLPVEHQDRLASIFELESDYNMDPNNDRGRSQIWERGMRAVAERPWGYGVQAHQMVDLRFGGRGAAAHNSFVEIAVELGVLGALLLLRVYAQSFFGLGKLRKALALEPNRTPTQNEQAVFYRMLQAGVTANMIAGFFLTMAYSIALWATVAVAMSCMALHAPAREQNIRRALVPGGSPQSKSASR
jgi:O-antigen ligase